MNVINFDWLMVFFVHEISMYEEILANLFATIKQVGNGRRNSIWLVLDKLEESNGGSRANRVIVVYRLEKRKDGSGEIHEFVEEVRNVDWRAAIRHVFKEAKADRKVFFTWSHGAAFGINTSDIGKILKVKFAAANIMENQIIEVRNEQWYVPQSKYRETDEFSKSTEDQYLADDYMVYPRDKEVSCEKLVVIWMSDLAKVLSEVTTGNGKIDLMIMMNCNMMLFENGYMLRECVDILIGSESKMWATGYDYKRLIEELNVTPDKGNDDIARMVVHDYIEKHKNLGYHDYLKGTALFACKLSETKQIAEILEANTSILFKRDNLVKDAVELIRKVYLYSVSGEETYFLVDLGLWLNTVISNFKSIGLDPEGYKRLDEIYNNGCVIHSHVGEDFKNNDRNNLKKYGHSGFSLFLPTDGAYISTRKYAWCAYNDEIRSTFKNELLWDEFVTKLNGNLNVNSVLQVGS